MEDVEEIVEDVEEEEVETVEEEVEDVVEETEVSFILAKEVPYCLFLKICILLECSLSYSARAFVACY